MRKNDEQKVNKLKKEKVKKEKTKKIPKRDNASRKEKKIKMKESSGGQKKEKSEIPFYRSIAMRLVGAFLIPVIGVLVLGDVSFVKFEFNFTGNIFLSGFNKCLDSLTEWCVPFSLVNNLCKLAAQFLLGFHCLTVKDQLLKLVMSCHQDCSARSLINTTGFHTNNTVLNDVNDTDTVLAA